MLNVHHESIQVGRTLLGLQFRFIGTHNLCDEDTEAYQKELEWQQYLYAHKQPLTHNITTDVVPACIFVECQIADPYLASLPHSSHK